ncbi:uncharacterized protein VTP21DRAFT_7286 [Calcarisporiella thermophila]|uniref:uncharacterized protein n=1 Tax=Calcarisporiella thermophila TaxID=911321 RepID=UPI0037431092
MPSEDPAITRFRNYLRIKTVQPNPDYVECTLFLQRWADELGLPSQVIECVPGKPIVIITWEGKNPSLPSILLNSHTDVVPVFPEQWTSEPFAADVRPNGDIVARGSQDMKCVGAWYMEAIARLKAEGKQPLRTIHVSFVPDEEIGGTDGMKAFTTRFRQRFLELNVGFALDEGIANPDDALKVFYGERVIWWLKLTATGNTGHGSQFIEGSATVKLSKVINKFLKYREEQEKLLQVGVHPDGRKYTLGDVTTLNLTMLQGGVQVNVIPENAIAAFDIRITPRESLKNFRKMLNEWVLSEPGVSYDFEHYSGENHFTALDDSNVWWNTLKNVCDEMDVKIEPEIFPAATDSRYLRALGIPALGISYLKNIEVLLHSHDEYIRSDQFLEGIEFYTRLIDRLANVQ